MQEHIMYANVGGIDRLLRIVVGLGLIAFALLSQHEYAMWEWVGVAPLATALFRRCPVYPPFGISTCKSD